MMHYRISPHDARTLRHGFLVIAGLLLLSRGMPAMHRWTSERRAAAASMQDEVTRAERSVRTRARTASALASTRARLVEYEGALLAATRAPAASAELAEIVSEAAELAEAGLVSIQLQVDSTGRAALHPVRARATLSGDLETLALFLHLLEEGPAIISVRELDITGGDARASVGAGERLRLQMVAQGMFAARPAEGRP